MNDIELILQIKEGNQQAFTFLIEKHKRLVLHIIVRMVKQQTEIEDVCQEVFIRIYNNLHKFRGEAKLSTWIAKIAYNVALNHIRKEEKKLLSIEENILEYKEPVFDNLPDKIFENKELKKQIIKEINKLPLHYRTTATLFYLEEFSYQEIEEITEIKQTTLRSNLSRARAILKEKLIFALNNSVTNEK